MQAVSVVNCHGDDTVLNRHPLLTLHYGNLVTYLRLNGLVPSGGCF
jgi:hypothetical protein